MDLVVGAKRVVVMMEHMSKDGRPKLLERCSLPLTGERCVSVVCTDLAWIDVGPDGLRLRELARGVTAAQVQRATEPRLIVDPTCSEMEL